MIAADTSTWIAYLEGGFLEWVREGGKYTGQRPEHYEELIP